MEELSSVVPVVRVDPKAEGSSQPPAEEVVSGQDNNSSRESSSESSISEIDPYEWVRQQMEVGASPKEILLSLVGEDCPLPSDLEEVVLWRLVLQVLTTPLPRKRLSHISSVQQVVELIQTSSHILVLSGAGISVSCGIPDFRSPDGMYARLSQEFPALPDPQAMFDIHYFRDDPRPFFRFAKDIFPGTFSPSPSHHFIAALEQKGKLLRNYTQNIDTLEQAAGISKVIYCHGSFATASCCECNWKTDIQTIKKDVFSQRVPVCPRCAEQASGGVLKPDIVFFGESLPATFHRQLEEDKGKADLLLVMGSSLKVRPVSLVPSVLHGSVPQVLINREPLSHMTFDVELIGYSDVVVAELCRRLGQGWEMDGKGTPAEIQTVTSHTHLFPGALMEAVNRDSSLDVGGAGSGANSSGRQEGDNDHELESRPKRARLDGEEQH